jgi:uncharacterized protein (DUF1684 family)
VIQLYLCLSFNNFMKKSLLSSLVILMTFPACSQTYGELIQLERDSINKVFSDYEQSILTDEDLEGFSGVHFYDADAKFRVEAKFRKKLFGKKFKMMTSTKRTPVYKPYGKLKFELEGKKYRLTLYQNMEPRYIAAGEVYLFLPFTDITSGGESYGGGRYLDFTLEEIENPIIDFNVCYNPYCAYNHKYSCPIPPLENHLDTEIRAGVKKWID